MGIKKINVVKEIYVCDECGGSNGYYWKHCGLCNKLLCEKCKIVQEFDGYDYWCQKCWNSGEDFRKKIIDIDEECYKRQQEVYAEWKKVATT